MVRRHHEQRVAVGLGHQRGQEPVDHLPAREEEPTGAGVRRGGFAEVEPRVVELVHQGHVADREAGGGVPDSPVHEVQFLLQGGPGGQELGLHGHRLPVARVFQEPARPAERRHVTEPFRARGPAGCRGRRGSEPHQGRTLRVQRKGAGREQVCPRPRAPGQLHVRGLPGSQPCQEPVPAAELDAILSSPEVEIDALEGNGGRAWDERRRWKGTEGSGTRRTRRRDEGRDRTTRDRGGNRRS